MLEVVPDILECLKTSEFTFLRWLHCTEDTQVALVGVKGGIKRVIKFSSASSLDREEKVLRLLQGRGNTIHLLQSLQFVRLGGLVFEEYSSRVFAPRNNQERRLFMQQVLQVHFVLI